MFSTTLAAAAFCAGVAIAALSCTTNSISTQDSSSPPDRPNIVLIVADDLGYGELGCYGQTKIRTPNIDRLASEGIRFTRFYSGAPTCAPSRCALLTGLHTGHAQIRANKAAPHNNLDEVGEYPITDEALTLAEVFRDNDYATGAMGKWGLGPVDSSGSPRRQGFELFFGYNGQSAAHSYFPPYLWRNEQRIPLNERPIPGHSKQLDGEVRGEDWLGKSYAPDSIVAAAIQFICEHRDKPFFLYLPFTEPHLAMHPPLRLIDSYPADWDSQPYRGENGYLPHPRPRAAYAALITSLDEHVGIILKTLDDCGLSEKTIVVFTSDNGMTHAANGNQDFDVGGVDATFFNSIAGLRGRKGSLYEGGIRVPLIVRWPKRIAAGNESSFVSFAPDLFPTLCAATRIEIPKALDGINLLPTIFGSDERPDRNSLVWAFCEYGGQVAVRFGDIKLIRTGLLTNQPSHWEVYDLAKDPNEQRDLAGEQPNWIETGKEILRAQVADNPVFPIPIPGVNQ